MLLSLLHRDMSFVSIERDTILASLSVTRERISPPPPSQGSATLLCAMTGTELYCSSAGRCESIVESDVARFGGMANRLDRGTVVLSGPPRQPGRGDIACTLATPPAAASWVAGGTSRVDSGVGSSLSSLEGRAGLWSLPAGARRHGTRLFLLGRPDSGRLMSKLLRRRGLGEPGRWRVPSQGASRCRQWRERCCHSQVGWFCLRGKGTSMGTAQQGMIRRQKRS